MPIRFACPTCGQRLSVGSHKAGKSAVCPKCKANVAIPQESSAEAASEEHSPSPPIDAPPVVSPPLAEERPLFDFDRGVEVVYETTTAVAPSPPILRSDSEALDFDRIALPRYVVFMQGILLAVVGMVCFMLGMAVGGAVSESGGKQTPTPVTVSGTASTLLNGRRSPDAGAVVIFLPFDAKPDEKASLIGLRPGDDPTQGERGRNFVRLLGGDVARCDQRGHYSVTLPERGRYFQLILSSAAKTPGGKELAPQQIAQIARFFDITEDPLSEFRVQWRTEALRASRNINVEFD
jgi:hypothetical protein